MKGRIGQNLKVLYSREECVLVEKESREGVEVRKMT
jgi:hypothetical protein